MKLTPKEQDRLTIFTLAELARKRRARGIKLNYPEAEALICDEVITVALHMPNYATDEQVSLPVSQKSFKNRKVITHKSIATQIGVSH